jgi:hypothetical protein
MVIQFNDILFIPQIVETVKKFLTVPVDVFENMLIDGMAKKDSLILVDRKEKDVRGFLFATIEGMDGEDVVFIHLSYVDPKFFKIGNELLARVRLWAKEKRKNWIYMMTDRNIQGFERRYGFRFYTHILRRRVTDETLKK